MSPQLETICRFNEPHHLAVVYAINIFLNCTTARTDPCKIPICMPSQFDIFHPSNACQFNLKEGIIQETSTEINWKWNHVVHNGCFLVFKFQWELCLQSAWPRSSFCNPKQSNSLCYGKITQAVTPALTHQHLPVL